MLRCTCVDEGMPTIGKMIRRNPGVTGGIHMEDRVRARDVDVREGSGKQSRESILWQRVKSR